MSYVPKVLTEFGWSQEEGQLSAVCMEDTITLYIDESNDNLTDLLQDD